MKTNIINGSLSLFFILTIFSMQAQPTWVQEDQRNIRYPTSTFLTGFSAAKNTWNEAGDEFMNKQVAIARTELINSIYTNLQSLSSLNIENKNTKTNEVYRLKTASFSKASISGLQVEKYYDSAAKTAYAFAFARKSSVIDYNKRLISENKTKIEELIQRGQSFKSSGNSRQALKTFYEGLTLLRNVETAQSVLLALNIDLDQLPHRESFNAYAITIPQEIDKLQSSKNLELNDVCYFLAYGLFLQLGAPDQALSIQSFPYENKGFDSPFSQQLQAQLQNQLIEVGKYTIKPYSEAISDAPILIKGSYWIDGENIKIIAIAEDRAEEQTLASAEASLPVNKISKGKDDLIPFVIRQLEKLQQIRLKAVDPRLEAKVNQMEQFPARVQLSSADASLDLSDIPVVFMDQASGKTLARVRSDQTGMANGILENLSASNKIQFAEAMIDIPAFLQMPPDAPLLNNLKSNIPTEKVRFSLKINGLNIQLVANEKDQYGNDISTPILGPKVKNALGKIGYTFTEDYSNADLYINIQAVAKQGKSFNGLFFSYIDATVSAMDLQSGKEVYSNSFENEKGGGGSFEQATMKAFQSIAETITNDLKRSLTQNKR